MIANALFAVCQLKVDVIKIQSIQKSDAGFYVLAVCGDVFVVAQASAAAAKCCLSVTLVQYGSRSRDQSFALIFALSGYIVGSSVGVKVSHSSSYSVGGIQGHNIVLSLSCEVRIDVASFIPLI